MTADKAPSQVTLLRSPAVSSWNAALATMYDELADSTFAPMSEDDLLPRIRAYDNNQRFTFGRAQTPVMRIGRFLEDFDLDWLERLHFDRPDESCFPVPWAELPCDEMATIIGFSLQELLGGRRIENEGMVTVFVHRTLVRAGEGYPGFFHRDLFPGRGAIGTAVWYPAIRHENIDGANLYAYTASQDISLEELRERPPDFEFTPAIYNGSTLIMRYPENIAHGVTPGTNTRPSASASPALHDFVKPDASCFVKDLVIITVSERSPVEQ